jgi:hypothetical protein
MVAVAVTPDAPYSLEQLHEALRYPVFPLYLGRKSHPLALPLMPLLLAGHAADVLRQAYRQYQEKFSLLRLSLSAGSMLVGGRARWFSREQQNTAPSRLSAEPPAVAVWRAYR